MNNKTNKNDFLKLNHVFVRSLVIYLKKFFNMQYPPFTNYYFCERSNTFADFRVFLRSKIKKIRLNKYS